jgi:signal transduction histidine kinase
MEWDTGCAETAVSRRERDSDPSQSGEGWSIVSPSAPRFAIGTREVERLPARTMGPTRFTRELAAVPEAAIAIDRRGLILDVNGPAAELLEHSREALIGRCFSDVVTSTHAGVVTANPGKHVRFLPASAGVSIVRAHAIREPVDVLVCPLDAHSSFAIVRPAIPSDQRLRDDDVAQIVHDLKNPLSLIALETDLLDHKLEAGDHVDVKYTVARILHNVAFLDRMVQDLLDLCSLEAGHFVLRPAPTEMRSLIESVIDRIVTGRDRASVCLEASEPVTLEIDDLRIERVIANFLTNALKYAPQATGIVVRLDRTVSRTCASMICLLTKSPRPVPSLARALPVRRYLSNT